MSAARSCPSFGEVLGVVLRLGGLTVLAVHVGLTAAYNMPFNPLKIQLQPVLARTVGTFFPQNWNLFAPSPVNSDYALLARPLTSLEYETFVRTGSLPSIDWFDLSTPLWSSFQENRLSAYDRIARPQTNALRVYLIGSFDLVPFHDACVKGDESACVFVAEQTAALREFRSVFLARVASSFCNARGPSCADATYVALRGRITRAVPWSQRYTGAPTVVDAEVGVFEIDRRVVPFGVFVGPQ